MATTYSISLSRTGGQGSKGDSISNIYVNEANDFLVDISDSAGNLLQTVDVGNIDTLIQDGVSEALDTAITGGSNTYITVAKTDGSFDFVAQVPISGLIDVDLTAVSDEDYLRYNSGTGFWENYDLKSEFYTKTETDVAYATVDHTHVLNDLTNVDTSGAVSGYALAYNGSSWVPTNLDSTYATDAALTAGLATKSNTSHTHALNDLSNVTASVTGNNWVLQYSTSLGGWQASAIGVAEVDGLQTALDGKAPTIHTHEFDTLSGVSLTSPADGEFLKYNGTNWVNDTPPTINTLDDVGDVTITTAGTGDIVSWNGSAWVNTYTIIDEDDMVSDSAVHIPSQQSVKAYVDNSIASQVHYEGGYDANTNTPDLDTSPSASITTGAMYTVTAQGDFFGTLVEVGDVLIAENDAPTTAAEWTLVNKNLDASSIKTSYESNSDTNAYTDAEKTKLAGIEAGADVTDATNVEAAGALMDSEVTNIAAVKAFDPTDYEPADATILKDADISVTVQAYSAVLAGTTASFTTADETKLDGIETGADVTDATNVEPLVDAHLNYSTATSGQLLSYNGSDYDWIDAPTSFDVQTATLATVTETAIATYATASYDGVKVVISADDGTDRTISEMVITWKSTTAYSTEYAVVNTGASAVATFDVDVSGGNFRILATGASATSTNYTVKAITL